MYIFFNAKDHPQQSQRPLYRVRLHGRQFRRKMFVDTRLKHMKNVTFRKADGSEFQRETVREKSCHPRINCGRRRTDLQHCTWMKNLF